MNGSLADRVPPMGALAVAVVAVSTSAILVRWSAAPSTVAAFYRVLFTVALVAPIAAVRHAGDFRRLSCRDALSAAVAGVALAVHFASWFESLNHTSVAASVTLVQTQPVFVAAGAALFLNERVDRRVIAGILVAVAGAAAMSLTGGETATVGGNATLGNALALVGAVAMAGYVLAGRSMRQRVALFPYVTVVYAACAATLFALVAAGDAPVVDYPPREWFLFLGMAVGPGVFGHTVLNWALEHVESSVVSVSLLGEPVGSTLLAALLLAEIPTAATALGGAVVLGGIYVTTTGRTDPGGG
ncbi:DMT family transporter [Halostella salina]|uniref:DMT family transporter n=1 Tax=Halostella salina TaxID=1547897 RepID=UPI000EF7E5D5|nr:DMT family transporter [Halostella salina]